MENTIRLMAEFIRECDCDSCEVCACKKKCNANFARAQKKGETYEPSESDCINGIIAYFEKNAKADKK